MYQALYRKYRPKDFNSVVGQDVIVKTLTNSIINNNFSHAYLFFGPRGTGKTTVSKIFARNINCLNSVGGIACGVCDACKNSFSKECIDIIEIDAASNNGVDEIRELKNKISLVPSNLKYKVYIIDEVHMLSIGAFNALLKTLEEPPEHVVFILATTDPQKVPETIVSRCQCFSFNRISNETIINKLVEICSIENISVDINVLKNIAVLSEGGLRDALGMLDKIISYSGKNVTLENFIEVNAILSDSDLKLFLDAILLGNISKVIEFLNFYDEKGKNLIQILLQLLNFARNLLVDYYLEKKELIYSSDLLLKLANFINENMFDVKKSSNVHTYIEILLLRFIDENINNLSDNKKLIVESVSDKDISNSFKDSKENNNFESHSNDFPKSKKCSILNINDIMKARINNTLALADKKLLKQELKNFELLKEYTFDQQIGYIVCSLLDSTVRVVSADNIIISFEYDSNVKQNLNLLDLITDVYNKITNSNKKFAIISDAEWNDIKSTYIINLKNNIKYEIIEEPEVIFEESDKDDIISNNAIELFGDIVEIE